MNKNIVKIALLIVTASAACIINAPEIPKNSPDIKIEKLYSPIRQVNDEYLANSTYLPIRLEDIIPSEYKNMSYEETVKQVNKTIQLLNN